LNTYIAVCKCIKYCTENLKTTIRASYVDTNMELCAIFWRNFHDLNTMAPNNRSHRSNPPNPNTLQDDSEEEEVEETPPPSTLASDARRENMELKRRIEELKCQVEMASAQTGSSSATATGEDTESGSVTGMQLPDGKNKYKSKISTLDPTAFHPVSNNHHNSYWCLGGQQLSFHSC
jgi:hypothetical protein